MLCSCSGLYARAQGGLGSCARTLVSYSQSPLFIYCISDWNYRRIDSKFRMWRSSATPPLIAEYDREWRQLRNSDGLERVYQQWQSSPGDERLSMRIRKEPASADRTSRSPAPAIFSPSLSLSLSLTHAHTTLYPPSPSLSHTHTHAHTEANTRPSAHHSPFRISLRGGHRSAELKMWANLYETCEVSSVHFCGGQHLDYITAYSADDVPVLELCRRSDYRMVIHGILGTHIDPLAAVSLSDS